jgi:uncharacterized protein YecA (UPF0149 family)
MNEEVKKSINEIKAELKSTDKETAERLGQLLEELELKLDVQNEENDLGEIVERFETAHPKLTDMFNRLAELLSNLGI